MPNGTNLLLCGYILPGTKGCAQKLLVFKSGTIILVHPSLAKESMIFFTYEMVEHAWNSVQEPVIIDTTISDPSGGDQPFFGNYLQGAGEGIIDTKEQVVLTRMGIMLWKVVTFYHRSIPEIEMELIHSKEHLNFQMLEYLSEEPENEFMETVDKIINTYTQSDLFRFFIDKIIEESERSNQPRTEMIGMIVVYLKTFIDCIDSVL